MKVLLIPLCIAGLLSASGCSKSSPTATPETIAETPFEPAVPAIEKLIAPTSKVVVATQTNHGSLANGKISEGAEPIPQYPNLQPPPPWLSALKPGDKMLLLSRYRSESQLSNKLALTIALSFIGDEEVAEEFRKTLLKTPFDHVLNFNEEHVILSTVEGLGMIAHTYESGLPFLRQATDPRYWKQNAPWKTHMGERQYGVVAGRALGAIAMSGGHDARHERSGDGRDCRHDQRSADGHQKPGSGAQGSPARPRTHGQVSAAVLNLSREGRERRTNCSGSAPAWHGRRDMGDIKGQEIGYALRGVWRSQRAGRRPPASCA
jgi:hypothetical protein